MKRIFLTIVAFLVITYAFPQKIEQATINFKIKNLGTHAKGTFSENTISGNFNTNDLENSKINVMIQVNSVDTGIKKRDKHLLEEDYFDAKKYPTIEFSSTKIKKKSETAYILYGKLTVKNTTKAVQFPLVVTNNTNSMTVKSNFVLSRKEYSVGGKSWILSDKVKAEVQFRVAKS